MKDQQRAADLVESLNVTILQLHRVIDGVGLIVAEQIAAKPAQEPQRPTRQVFGAVDLEHRITCPRCGLLLR